MAIVDRIYESIVRLGLVASLARPGGNLTGINFFNGELIAKRLELLRELVPTAIRVAVLVNPADATNSESALREVNVAARAMGLQIQVLNARTSGEINAAFATFCASGPTPSSLAATPSSTADGCNLPTWRRATQFPQYTQGAILPKPAG